jgi:hypothetical protein
MTIQDFLGEEAINNIAKEVSASTKESTDRVKRVDKYFQRKAKKEGWRK